MKNSINVIGTHTIRGETNMAATMFTALLSTNPTAAIMLQESIMMKSVLLGSDDNML
jgi:hypothetical protein